MDAIRRRADAFLNNGRFQYGFVVEADKGLRVAEYVPYGSVRNIQEDIREFPEDNTFAADYVACLLSDASTVEAVCTEADIDVELWPLVAAGRASSFACGWLGSESVAAQAAVPDEAAVLDAYGHVAEASLIGIQVATIVTYICTVNYFNTNHNTGGPTLPKSYLRTIRSVLGLNINISDRDVTTAVRLGGHASDKRLILRHFIGLEEDLVQVRSYMPNYFPAFDSWATIRSEMRPAGTHIIGVLKEILKVINVHGLSGFSPAPDALALWERESERVDNAGPHAHPGARFLFGIDPVGGFAITEAKEYVGKLGVFCVAARKANSITTAPHIQEIIREHGLEAWRAMGTTIRDGLAIDMTRANAAMRAVNAVGVEGIADPTQNPVGYQVYNTAVAARLAA